MTMRILPRKVEQKEIQEIAKQWKGDFEDHIKSGLHPEEGAGGKAIYTLLAHIRFLEKQNEEKEAS